MYLGIFALLVTFAVFIKIFEDRLPVRIYRLAILLYVVTPLVALAYAVWSLWGDGIGIKEIVLFAVLYALTGLGTGIGYHRLLTHRSFETTPALKGVFVVLGAMAMPTRPVDFAANHLKHHAFSDRDGDPHSPLDGMFHSHLGWILRAARPDRERYCKKLIDDPVIMFVDRTAPLWFIFGLLVPFLLAGLPGLVWGGLIRYGFHNHVTFAVNSICHTFGDRPFATPDESRNNWLIGLLAFGEGWHNNHHAFPAMAYHGMGPRQFDLNGLVIRSLVRLGLAWNVKQPSPELIARRTQASFASAAD